MSEGLLVEFNWLYVCDVCEEMKWGGRVRYEPGDLPQPGDKRLRICGACYPVFERYCREVEADRRAGKPITSAYRERLKNEVRKGNG